MREKNLLLSLFCFCAHLCAEEPSPPVYPSHFYIDVLGGPNFLQNSTANENQAKYHVGYVVAGSLGYCLCNGLCLEVEYAFRRNGIQKIAFFTEGSSTQGRFQTSSYMANLLWEIHPWRFWKAHPLIGAGVGYDFEQMSGSNARIAFNQKWHPFSWQLMAGFAFAIFHNIDLNLEYKFHQGGSEFNNHSLEMGFAYKFGFSKG